MSDLLLRAMEEVVKLPERDQDAIGALLLEELASERRWTEAFASSQDSLEAMADEAPAELREDRTRDLDLG